MKRAIAGGWRGAKNPNGKAGLAHGQRVQLSVFERRLNEERFDALEARLHDESDPEYDSLRIYLLPKERTRRVRVYGRALAYEINETLIL